ncbi:MAG TPA: PQQ-binding-like beta-propeller repeat protein [Gemmataceae bacterium]|jgi:outer membrane protein assembly factor BamB|nr:PQQ-binding-like beta-propeller repeat protein [Gemmataceae bacterium]
MISCLHGRLVVLVSFALTTPALAGDWPAWRHDARRSAATPDELPAKLQLQWTLALPALKSAWPDQPLMPFDAAYEPIIAGHSMYVGSSRTDSVTAYDTRTGALQWRFLADGPVRFAPLFNAGKLYIVSDDGYLYCLDAASGAVRWKVRGGPSDRKILGNDRLISTWPARGAPVIADGTVYFAASIWPFMGVFIHALEAETGKTIWTNDADGSMYIKQPHGADSFAGVAPQGPMAISGDLLMVPGGRSVPAAYDRKTGRQRHFLLNENSKKGGGHVVAIAGDVFFNGTGVFLNSTGRYLGDASPMTVVADDLAFTYTGGEVRVLDLKHAEIKPSKWAVDTIGHVPLPGLTAMMKAGNHLVVGIPGKVAAIALPLANGSKEQAVYTWQVPIKGTPVSLVAADDRLFVSTKEGRLYCFGEDEGSASARPQPEYSPGPIEQPVLAARDVVAATNVTEGYSVVWSADVSFITDLIQRTRLHVIAIDPNPERVRAAREALIAAHLYGERCAVHVGQPGSFPLPPYIASLMVAPSLTTSALPAVYESLRPYGGTLVLPRTPYRNDDFRKAEASLPRAVVKFVDDVVLITREGALPGAADWTHEHADAANTRVSKDSVVKAPLGVLWFGGTSNEGILPRHGHGPQPQVVGGRIIIEGPDLLRATDAYTGRLLWETSLPGLGEFYNNTAHQPGANARGTNYISMPDGIYVAYKNSCLRLDPATGKQVAEFKFPPIGDDPNPPRWGHLNVVGDYLVGAADPLFTAELEKQAKSASKLFKTPDADLFAASRYLAVLNRHTGKVLWTDTARVGFRHNTICSGNGKLFAIDRLSAARLMKLKEEGEAPLPPRVIAFDLATGKELWHDDADTFGTWLSYSEKLDVLVEAGRVARDTLSDEPTGMRAYRGVDGKELWFEKNFVGPAMLHGDTILRGQGACDLLTGKPKMRRDPITGELEEWVWSRNYGCNTPAASEHLMTFRSGAAGFFDLCHDGGTGNLGGFRSSCTNNLVVADGVLAAPDYTRTCTCSYQNQCSIALVPMADAEEWTFYGKNKLEKVVQRVGINFGAPGDRRSTTGTLWLEYPSTGGASPAVPVLLTGSKLEYYRRHQSSVAGEMPWVGSSGVRGVESVAVTLLPTEMEARHYTVRLHFAEPDDLNIGDRIFSVTVQGRRGLDNFDIVKEAGGAHKSIVKEFRNVRVTDELRLSFHAIGKRPAILCGIEVVGE